MNLPNALKAIAAEAYFQIWSSGFFAETKRCDISRFVLAKCYADALLYNAERQDEK